nr:glycoside hydrolase family 95 protein [Bacteroidales bacterium]
PVPTGGPELLAKVRALLDKEDWRGAEEMVKGLQGKYVNSFLPMGSLHLRQKFDKEVLVFDYHGNNAGTAALRQAQGPTVTGYTRTLDLDSAITRTSFSLEGVTYSREMFVSHPDRVMVIHLTASEPKLEFDLDGATMWDGSSIQSLSANEYLVKGQVGYYQSTKWEEPFSRWQVGPNGEKGMRYQFRVKVVKCDGAVYTSPCLHVSNASDVVILVSAATSFNGFDKRPDTEGRDENALAESFIARAEGKTLEALRNDHVADYRKLFSTVSLSLSMAGVTAGDAAGLRPYSAAAERGWTRPGPDGRPANDNLSTLEENPIMAKAERDLLNFILANGTTTLEFQSDSEFYPGDGEEAQTVFDFISQALEADETGFANSAYQSTYDAYSDAYYEGYTQDEIVKRLLDSADRTVAFVASQLSTDERYDLSVKNLRDAMMSKGSWLTKFVPKSILVFQACRLEDRERSLKEDLRKAQTIGDQNREVEIMQSLVRLRKAIKAVKVRLGREK